jgi:hypothetical protein
VTLYPLSLACSQDNLSVQKLLPSRLSASGTLSVFLYVFGALSRASKVVLVRKYSGRYLTTDEVDGQFGIVHDK